MNSFTLLMALSLGWICLSVSASQTVDVQSGEAVMLMCPNMSSYDSLTFWFRLVNKVRISCISVMYKTSFNVFYCEGFQNGTFEMSSNKSTVFLNINRVDLCDSGLYFCGFYTNANTVFSVIQLNVKEGGDGLDDDDDDDMSRRSIQTANLMKVIIVILTAFFITVISGLVVKIRKLQKADNEETNHQGSKTRGSDDFNYATVTFGPHARRRELESSVVYAATR
ncbi:uncharacterized protein LOC129603501 isoform X2 [Betta splendens]|uniref:Uncharacterized protein LOC129603501 isoform X2 n=1 Tax=Betta splendens TaxID=158456 RepID=A0A9W2XH29_BETSP|nr:uncharacterized protein LOC129603501 isoform X2 [Betta splendens]